MWRRLAPAICWSFPHRRRAVRRGVGLSPLNTAISSAARQPPRRARPRPHGVPPSGARTPLSSVRTNEPRAGRHRRAWAAMRVWCGGTRGPVASRRAVARPPPRRSDRARTSTCSPSRSEDGGLRAVAGRRAMPRWSRAAAPRSSSGRSRSSRTRRNTDDRTDGAAGAAHRGPGPSSPGGPTVRSAIRQRSCTACSCVPSRSRRGGRDSRARGEPGAHPRRDHGGNRCSRPVRRCSAGASSPRSRPRRSNGTIAFDASCPIGPARSPDGRARRRHGRPRS